MLATQSTNSNAESAIGILAHSDIPAGPLLLSPGSDLFDVAVYLTRRFQVGIKICSRERLIARHEDEIKTRIASAPMLSNRLTLILIDLLTLRQLSLQIKPQAPSEPAFLASIRIIMVRLVIRP